MEGLGLRAFELKDLSRVITIEKESFPEQPYGRLDFLSYMLTSRDGFVVAHTEEASVVGYVIAALQGGEGSIASIAVAPSFRGRGVGELLMRSALDHLRGKCARVRLLVDVDNAPAIRLYQRLSFERTGRVVRAYYPNGNDAIEMMKEFGP